MCSRDFNFYVVLIKAVSGPYVQYESDDDCRSLLLSVIVIYYVLIRFACFVHNHYSLHSLTVEMITDRLSALTPLPGNKIFEIFSHMCNICNTYPEKAVTALGRVISGYMAT